MNKQNNVLKEKYTPKMNAMLLQMENEILEIDMSSMESKRQELLFNLEEEITSLEEEIEKTKKENKRNSRIRNFKISLRLLQGIAPYVLVATTLVGGFKMLGLGLPFYKDKVKDDINVKKTFDSFGNVSYVKTYDEFSNSTNMLFYYSNWKKNDDNSYSRDIEVYDLKKITEEDIIKIITKNDIDLKGVLWEPISTQKEFRDNISLDELEQREYLEAIIYYEDKNEYIVMKEDGPENLAFSFCYIALTFICSIGIKGFRKVVTHFYLTDCIYKIKKKYPLAETSGVKKLLEIKRSNYERLKR